jgi:hypothetical protein
MRIEATLTTLNPGRADVQHATDEAQFAAIEAHYESTDDAWPYPPVLVVEDEGNGATILDGHHRVRLAREWGLTDIPAYEISVSDYCALLEEHFDGSTPNRLSDLDAHILCDGEVYSR